MRVSSVGLVLALTTVAGLGLATVRYLPHLHKLSAATKSAVGHDELKTAGEGRAEGELDAMNDVAAGVLGWRTLDGWGLPLPHHDQTVSVADVLERDFGVEVDRIKAGSGCMPPPDEQYLLAKVSAYNARMEALIVAKHGADVFAIAQSRATGETKRKIAEFERAREQRSIGNESVTCNPPWRVDASGVRIYKRECL